jgi:hypothetical protein
MLIVAAAQAAAHELALFSALATPQRPGPLATALGVGAERLGWLLDLLTAANIVERHGDGVDARYSVERAPPRVSALGGTLLATVLRRDAPLTADEWLGSVEAAALMCHHELTRVPEALVDLLVSLVGDGLLVDVGSGDGAIARAVLQRAPRARACLVDQRHHDLTAHAGIERLTGDALQLTLPQTRLALLSNLLHTVTRLEAQALVARVAAALSPGGALVVREVALDGDRRGPRFGLGFGLSLATFSTGELLDATTLGQLLVDAGLALQPLWRAEEYVVLSAVRRA